MNISLEISATDREVRRLLAQARRVAVFGASKRVDHESYHVIHYLMERGYDVIPINPKYRMVAQQPCFNSLDDLRRPVDVVVVFGRPDTADAAVAQAIRNGARAVWLEQGLTNSRAARQAADAGLVVVQDRSIFKEYRDHFGR